MSYGNCASSVVVAPHGHGSSSSSAVAPVAIGSECDVGEIEIHEEHKIGKKTTCGSSEPELPASAAESAADDHTLQQHGDDNMNISCSSFRRPKTPCGASSMTVPFYRLFSQADALDCLLMSVGALASMANGASLPVFIIFLGRLIDSLGQMSTDMTERVMEYALYFVYLSVLRFGCGWLAVSLWLYTGDRQAARLRRRYVRALLAQEVGFFDTAEAGSTAEVITGISADTTLLHDAIGTKTGNLIHCFAQFITGFVVAFSTLWRLTLLTLAVMPVIALNGGICAYIMVGLSSKSKRDYVRAGQIAYEVISQIRTVQAFVGEGKAYRSYRKALETSIPIGKRTGLVKGLGIGSLYGMGFASFSLLLWYAGKIVRAGDANGGVAFTTILNVIASSLALGQAGPDMAAISKAKVSGYTILEVINRKPMVAGNNDDGIRLEKIQGNIDFRNVTFSYPSRPDVYVFQNFSLEIPAGKVVAIVGSSGSGKSTVISLIERFYDPTSGEVLLDGNDIKKMQLKWLREQMGLVNQEPALFATSIKENIMYGKVGGQVSMDEVIKAASISCAHDFIDALPKGYETQVGERGLQLSGGQKQRIAIARAVLKNPSILLLDEATSALDSESEKGVQDALDRVMLGRTTVVVAHRLSTIQNADIIAVVEDGKVAEIGTHGELLEKGGSYATLIKVQKKAPARPSPADMHRLDSRNSRGSFSGSLSQRTFSFRSNADSVVPVGLKVNGLEIDDLVGPRPSLKRLMQMNASEWKYGLLAAIGAIAAGSQTPLFALIITQALEYFYSPDDGYMKRGLDKVAILCCAAGVVALLAYTCEFYFTELAGERITLRVRSQMFSAILKNEVSWFDQSNSTALTARLSADAALVRSVIVDRTVTLLQNVGLIVTAFVIAIRLQWKIALVIISTFPAMIASYAGQMQFIKGFSGDLNKAYMRANMVAGEAVSNIRTVSAFSAEEKVMELFNKELEKTQRRSLIRGQVTGLFFGFSQFLLMSTYSMAFWYSAGVMKRGEASFGQVMKCFMVLIITAFGVAEALSLAPAFLRGSDSLRAVFRIIDRRTEIEADDPKAEEMGKNNNVKGAIELRHVEFCYPTRPDVQIFKDLNVKVRAGQSLALVGSSGSGKSSVIALIARFYDPQFGRVIIDGKDMKQYRLTSVRQHIGLVQQEPALFSTTIYGNIAYGKDGASEAEIVEAAKAANAHNFITALPEGYGTEVGERGVQLSGGQKQRVAIARAVLRNPAILLLDEATSALDTESEKLVQEALDRLMQRRTTVLVAHRLSTIKNANTIAVLHNGCITEQGSHGELVAKQGAYFNLLGLAAAHAQDQL